LESDFLSINTVEATTMSGKIAINKAEALTRSETYSHTVAMAAIASIFKTAGLDFGDDLKMQYKMANRKGEAYGDIFNLDTAGLMANCCKISYYSGGFESVLLIFSSKKFSKDILMVLVEYFAEAFQYLKVDNDSIFHMVDSGMLDWIQQRNKELIKDLEKLGVDLSVYQSAPNLEKWYSVKDIRIDK